MLIHETDKEETGHGTRSTHAIFMKSLKEFITATAREAGALLRSRFGRSHTINFKGVSCDRPFRWLLGTEASALGQGGGRANGN